MAQKDRVFLPITIAVKMVNNMVIVTGDIDLTKISNQFREHLTKIEHKDGIHQHLKFSALPFREKDNIKPFSTHSVMVDDFDYESYKKEKASKQEEVSDGPVPDDEDDLPF